MGKRQWWSWFLSWAKSVRERARLWRCHPKRAACRRRLLLRWFCICGKASVLPFSAFWAWWPFRPFPPRRTPPPSRCRIPPWWFRCWRYLWPIFFPRPPLALVAAWVCFFFLVLPFQSWRPSIEIQPWRWICWLFARFARFGVQCMRRPSKCGSCSSRHCHCVLFLAVSQTLPDFHREATLHSGRIWLPLD